MSRVGKKSILIPKEIEVKTENQKIIIKGPKGTLSLIIRPEISVEVKNDSIFVKPRIETKQTKAFWGTTRALIANMIQGLISGYEKKLELRGIGYKAEIKENSLILSVGFSHPVKFKKPEGIDFQIKKNIITISGFDKAKVNQIAAKIRSVKPPEPYKGKGIRYVGEEVRRKLGKKAITTTT